MPLGVAVDAIITELSTLETDIEATNTALALIRWGIPREPAWEVGAENTTPDAAEALVTKAVTAGKTGRVFGVHISSPEANEFQLSVGATVKKRFALLGAGTIHIVLSLPLIDAIAAEASITIKVVNAGTGALIYQASLLYDEA